MTATQNEQLAKRETHRLIAADKVEGTPVKNRLGDTLGTVEKVMIDKQSGRVAYAVMSFGGFLGIGESRHPLPWGMLTYDTGVDAYVVDIDADKLEKAPTFMPGEDVDWADEDWARRLHDYYGARPYWTS
ncbi:MAG: PRC-barrel domain-containing protein [Rhodospirillaceae bacterium]|nr:PRC-barrel domain-containing protein [Rhodospirillaceae bacterium]